MNTLLHTPEGVRDIYNTECARKIFIEDKLHDVIKAYGYNDIEAPSFEFFDIFNKERGSVASKEMYKFFDREGNTLVLRPDMTPQIARIAAKYYSTEKLPIKLCYKGHKFVNNTSYQGKLKETTQVGAELIGNSSIDSDAEIIVMLVESLLAAGLKEFQVEVGNINYFRGLVSQAGISDEIENSILEMIQNKNYFGLEEIIKAENIKASIGEVLLKLPQLFGSVDILNNALMMADNDTSKEAINHLLKLHDILKLYGVDKYITYDLGMLNKLRYYTGVMFTAFTYGMGDYIASGGRYDKLIGQFGTDRQSIGYSITVDNLLTALDRQNIHLDIDKKQVFLLGYLPKDRESAIKLAGLYRQKEINVNMLCEDSLRNHEEYMDYCKGHGISHFIIIDNDDVVITQVLTGNKSYDKISNIL